MLFVKYAIHFLRLQSIYTINDLSIFIYLSRLKCEKRYSEVFWSKPKGPGKRRHIVADTLLPTQIFPRLLALATFVADTHKFCVPDTKKCFWFCSETLCVRKMFSQFAPARKRHEQQCFRNNVSSFATALRFLACFSSVHHTLLGVSPTW